MKKLALLLSISLNILLVAGYFAGCKKESSSEYTEEKSTPEKHFIGGAIVTTINPTNYSRMIPIDTANKMIRSYLNSIGYPNDESQLKSLIYNADSLRKYLADTSIKNIKLMFAHSQDYINSGGLNTNCGYTAGALTIVMAGYNRFGNYVTPGGMVPDRAMPCPSHCPTVGSASSDFLP